MTTNDEKEYFGRSMNPNSAFIDEPEVEMIFSKEHGTLILDVLEAPRNVFTGKARSSRKGKEQFGRFINNLILLCT